MLSFLLGFFVFGAATTDVVWFLDVVTLVSVVVVVYNGVISAAVGAVLKVSFVNICVS